MSTYFRLMKYMNMQCKVTPVFWQAHKQKINSLMPETELTNLPFNNILILHKNMIMI